jgi:hypothetical protein
MNRTVVDMKKLRIINQLMPHSSNRKDEMATADLGKLQEEKVYYLHS